MSSSTATTWKFDLVGAQYQIPCLVAGHTYSIRCKGLRSQPSGDRKRQMLALAARGGSFPVAISQLQVEPALWRTGL